MESLLNKNEVASHIGMSRRDLNEYIARGEGPTCENTGTKPQWRKATVSKWYKNLLIEGDRILTEMVFDAKSIDKNEQ